MGKSPEDPYPNSGEDRTYQDEVAFHARTQSAAIKAVFGFILGFGVCYLLGVGLGYDAVGLCMGPLVGLACAFRLARLTT